MSSIDELGSDIAELMLRAYCDEPELHKTSPEETIPIVAQKSFLCANINKVDRQNRIAVANVIVINGLRDRLKECNDGLTVDLDKLPDNVVNQMYLILNERIPKNE